MHLAYQAQHKRLAAEQQIPDQAHAAETAIGHQDRLVHRRAKRPQLAEERVLKGVLAAQDGGDGQRARQHGHRSLAQAHARRQHPLAVVPFGPVHRHHRTPPSGQQQGLRQTLPDHSGVNRRIVHPAIVTLQGALEARLGQASQLPGHRKRPRLAAHHERTTDRHECPGLALVQTLGKLPQNTVCSFREHGAAPPCA
jgi:hypothetical protein